MSASPLPASRIVVPEPPVGSRLEPLLTTWPAERLLVRSYSAAWGSRDFYAGDPANPSRFSPFTSGRRRSPVPVLYAAGDLDGAISETVFHSIPTAGIKSVPRSWLTDRLAVDLEPVRDLTLVDLTSDGLKRLGVSRAELIETGPRHYQRTALWARELHGCPAATEGLMWVSRQRDTSLAVVLFGDRVKVSDLRLRPGVIPTLLAAGPGYDRVAALADRAGITISEAG